MYKRETAGDWKGTAVHSLYMSLRFSAGTRREPIMVMVLLGRVEGQCSGLG